MLTFPLDFKVDLKRAFHSTPPDMPDAFGKIQVPGGTFTECEASENGGFLFASDGSVVTVTGGNIVNNKAKRGAAVSHGGRDCQVCFDAFHTFQFGAMWSVKDRTDVCSRHQLIGPP